MDNMSCPVPGPQPGSDQTVSPTPSGAVPAVRGVASRTALERRRSPLQSSPSLSTEAELLTADERILIELRRKVQAGELLSASTERLLWKMRFNGHLTVVVHNGRVLKSGYEEGYFRRRNDLGGFLLDT